MSSPLGGAGGASGARHMSPGVFGRVLLYLRGLPSGSSNNGLPAYDERGMRPFDVNEHDHYRYGGSSDSDHNTRHAPHRRRVGIEIRFADVVMEDVDQGVGAEPQDAPANNQADVIVIDDSDEDDADQDTDTSPIETKVEDYTKYVDLLLKFHGELIEVITKHPTVSQRGTKAHRLRLNHMKRRLTSAKRDLEDAGNSGPPLSSIAQAGSVIAFVKEVYRATENRLDVQESQSAESRFNPELALRQLQRAEARFEMFSAVKKSEWLSAIDGKLNIRKSINALFVETDNQDFVERANCSRPAASGPEDRECPICLFSLTVNPEIGDTDANTANATKAASRAPAFKARCCGQNIHLCCISEYLKLKNTLCPLCRQQWSQTRIIEAFNDRINHLRKLTGQSSLVLLPVNAAVGGQHPLATRRSARRRDQRH